MRLKLIACKAMAREFSHLAAVCENNIDITFLRQGYHETPRRLQEQLQAEIDAVEGGRDPRTNLYALSQLGDEARKLEDFDAILLGYGLCSNGVVGLRAGAHPLVIPRAHDCMTLFLGSRQRYMDYFKAMPGCFWYTGSWIENSPMPCREYQEQQRQYLEDKGYDEDMLDFCLEELTGWTKNYHYAAFIKMPFFNRESWERFTKEAAEYYNWEYRQVDGDLGLLERFLRGDWAPEDFLVVPPGCRVVAGDEKNIIDWVRD